MTPGAGPSGGGPRLVYLYGFVAADDPSVSSALEGASGVGDRAAPSLVTGGRVAAIVSHVPAAQFSQDALSRKLNDLESLEAIARAHERVLDAVIAHTTVLPARLATLYRSEDDVRRLLGEREAPLADVLQRLEGTREWGVKVVAERPRLTTWIERETGQRASPAAAARTEGAAYLTERRRQQALERRVAEEIVRHAEEVHTAAKGVAAGFALVKTHAELPSEAAGELALNAAYLVRRADEGEFQRTVRALADRHGERGFLVSVTGPWPPYNFVEGKAA